MIETPEERVGLLKTGLNGKQIESLYLNFNNFTVTEMDWHDPEPTKE